MNPHIRLTDERLNLEVSHHTTYTNHQLTHNEMIVNIPPMFRPQLGSQRRISQGAPLIREDGRLAPDIYDRLDGDVYRWQSRVIFGCSRAIEAVYKVFDGCKAAGGVVRAIGFKCRVEMRVGIVYWCNCKITKLRELLWTWL